MNGPRQTWGTIDFVRPEDCHPRIRRAGTDDGLSISEQPHMIDYFGRTGRQHAGVGRPEAFLVDFPPAGEVGAHFHSCHQFQVFLPAPGVRYQRTAIDALTVHFADAYATYGPFSTGEARLEYFTLRAVPSTVTAYMPGSRDQMIRRGRRNLHAAVPHRRNVASDVVWTELLEEADDGMYAAHVTAPVGTSIELPRCPTGSGGRYVYVARGTVSVMGARCPERSLGWSDPGDAEVTLDVADAEVELVLMQFPQETSV